MDEKPSCEDLATQPRKSPSCVTEKASRVALPDFERPGSAE